MDFSVKIGQLPPQRGLKGANMKDATPLPDLAATVVLAGQTLGLRLLLAEMQALTQVLPGFSALHATQSCRNGITEADFDNLPV